MSRERMNPGAGSFNRDAFSQPTWTPANLQASQPQHATHAPQPVAGGALANPYGFPPTYSTPGQTFSAFTPALSSAIIDDRQFFPGTPVPPNACYSPLASSEASTDTRPSTGMDSDYRERSVVSSPSPPATGHVGPSGLRSDSTITGTSPERHHSVRDVRKRAYDHATRLEKAARQAGEDAEANLSVIAFSARPDTKEHSNNTPRLYASHSIIEAFAKRGIPDLKAYLISIAYDTHPREDLPTPELVAKLTVDLSVLTERFSQKEMDCLRMEEDMVRLQRENERLRRIAEGHQVVSAKLQEVLSLSYDYMGYIGAQQPGMPGAS
ncbi:hypothetical protein EIP91_011901 [Steccherinum ochraceum]|uniref:Uncharacterized protein n=1 Tax=Steccherinum ochraceum TaxID=92696 RepID=A0A4R0RR00_9APHY|nr:hypothetical protein EIP91_011901 [Steccherinum ochraceum]